MIDDVAAGFDALCTVSADLYKLFEEAEVERAYNGKLFKTVRVR
jgi:hypothetical protein